MPAGEHGPDTGAGRSAEVAVTPAQATSLTAHLATKVCGWHRGNSCWASTRGRLIARDDFAPLTDPRDTEMVMEAWKKSGCAWAILSTFNRYMNATVWRRDGFMRA